MKTKIILSSIGMFVGAVTISHADVRQLYVGGYSNSISLIKFDTQNQKIFENKTFKSIENPSYILLTPEYLYATSEVDNGKVAYYKYAKDGIDSDSEQVMVSGGQTPVYLSMYNDKLFIANYALDMTSPTAVSYDITNKNYHIDLINKGHIHSIVPLKINKDVFVYAVDLANSKIYRYTLTKGGIDIASRKDFDVTKNSTKLGPRQIAVSADKKYMYVADEGTGIESQISVFAINHSDDVTNGDLKLVENVDSYKDGSKPAKNVNKHLLHYLRLG